MRIILKYPGAIGSYHDVRDMVVYPDGDKATGTFVSFLYNGPRLAPYFSVYRKPLSIIVEPEGEPMKDQNSGDTHYSCDLCNRPAEYHLCQHHLDDQTGNSNEDGTLAVERERQLNEKLKLALELVDHYRHVLIDLEPLLQSIPISTLIKNITTPR